MDRGAWQATVHRVARSQTWLKQLSMHAHVESDSQLGMIQLGVIWGSFVSKSPWGAFSTNHKQSILRLLLPLPSACFCPWNLLNDLMGVYYVCECCGNRKILTIIRKGSAMCIWTIQLYKVFWCIFAHCHPFLKKIEGEKRKKQKEIIAHGN